MSSATRICACFALALAILISGCATSVSSYRDRDQSEAMESVLRAQEASWNRGDLDEFLREGYVQSPSLTFFSGGEAASRSPTWKRCCSARTAGSCAAGGTSTS